MKKYGKFCSGTLQGLFAIILITGCQGLMAQDPPHANTPPEIYPFNNFQSPHYRHFEERLPYLGAAREYDYLTDADTVKIGFIGPLDGEQVYYTKNGRQMMNGTLLALEEANRSGGYSGKPFDLIARNDIGLWGASGNELVALHDEGVIAVVGSIDGNNSHIAIRVALKLEIPIVNTGSTDPSLTDTRIPWLIRTNPDDRQYNYALLNEIYNKRKYTRTGIIRANSRYGRMGTKEFVDGAKRLGYPVSIRQVYFPGETNFDEYLENIRRADAEAVLIWGEVDEIARIITQMRESGMNQVVFSSHKVVSDTFIKLAGGYAEGVIGVYPFNPTAENQKLSSFIENYTERFGEKPNTLAIQAYDGTTILINSIRKAGLNRALVRDELTSIRHTEGLTGEIVLDDSWNNVSPVWLAEYRDGEFSFWPYKWIDKTENNLQN